MKRPLFTGDQMSIQWNGQRKRNELSIPVASPFASAAACASGVNPEPSIDRNERASTLADTAQAPK